jgi:hypothetical protein
LQRDYAQLRIAKRSAHRGHGPEAGKPVGVIKTPPSWGSCCHPRSVPDSTATKQHEYPFYYTLFITPQLLFYPLGYAKGLISF